MWQNPEVARALHRARAIEAGGRARPRREQRARRAAHGLVLRPAAAPQAR